MKDLIEIAKRTFYVNSSLIYWYLMLMTIVYFLFIISGDVYNDVRMYLIFGLTMNPLFSIIFFIGLYLQELKNKELQFLITMQLSRRSIVGGKFLFSLLFNWMFNLLICLPIITFNISAVSIINYFFICSLLGVTISIILLGIYLLYSFEVFLIYQQYIRLLMIIIVIVTTRIIRVTTLNISSALEFNPLISILFYTAVIFLLYRKSLYLFEHKTSNI